MDWANSARHLVSPEGLALHKTAALALLPKVFAITAVNPASGRIGSVDVHERHHSPKENYAYAETQSKPSMMPLSVALGRIAADALTTSTW